MAQHKKRQPGLDLNGGGGGGNKLFVNCPDASQVHGSVPCIQNGHHFAYSLQVVFENRFEIVAARGSLLQKDTELVVDEEANVEIARPHQTVSKHLQRALHLQQSILFLDSIETSCFNVHVSALATLRFDRKNKQRKGRNVNHQPTRMQVGVTSKPLL